MLVTDLASDALFRFSNSVSDIIYHMQQVRFAADKLKALARFL